jgi:hypothetical protein
MPKEPTKYHPYQDLPPILYLLGQMTIIGSFLILFLVTYLTFDDNLFNSRYTVFIKGMKLILLSGIILLLLQLFLFRQKKTFNWIFNSRSLKIKNDGIFIYGTFIGLLGLSLILQSFNSPFHLLNLLLLVLILAFLWIFARGYDLSPDRPAWNHPTTSGGIVQGAIAIGISIGLWIFPDPRLQISLGRWLLILLAIEIFTLWSRFRFLSRANLHTRASLKTILGSHLILFAIRFIFGLIMPLAYLHWVLLISSSIPLHPVILMVLVGEMSERLLFFVSSPPLTDNETQPAAADNLSSQ